MYRLSFRHFLYGAGGVSAPLISKSTASAADRSLMAAANAMLLQHAANRDLATLAANFADDLIFSHASGKLQSRPSSLPLQAVMAA